MSIYSKLILVQVELKAPKSQYNGFGKYNYRNLEDILNAVKPLLLKNNLSLILKDDVIQVSNRVYVKSFATLIDTETSEMIEVSALAREAETKKGMDDSQITGSSSSYARKYALNGLFCIDDTKDADNQDNSQKPKQKTKLLTPKETDFIRLKLDELELKTHFMAFVDYCKTKERVQLDNLDNFKLRLKGYMYVVIKVKGNNSDIEIIKGFSNLEEFIVFFKSFTDGK